MTGAQDRRAYVRVDFAVPAVLCLLGDTAELTGKTVNVSAGGVMMRSSDVGGLQIGSKLWVRIQCSREPWVPCPWLRGTGRVVWMAPELEGQGLGSAGKGGLLGLSFDQPLKFEN